MEYACVDCKEPACWSGLDCYFRCDECRIASGLEPRGAKHGPGGRGGPGPCDSWCAKCKKEKERKISALNEDFRVGKIKLTDSDFMNPVKWDMAIDYGLIINAPKPKIDPLDVVIDGIPLGVLLRIDEDSRRDTRTARNWGHEWTTAQRAAVSAHWSAQLRAKVAESSKPKLTVMMAIDPEDL